MYQRLMRDYARGRSCWARLAFADVCQHVSRAFSSRFFKTHFWAAAMDLAGDGVANVRLHVTSLLPLLKMALRLPEDVDRLVRGHSHAP